MPWDTGSHNLCGCDNYHIYLNARQGFFLKFCTSICEVVLNSHIKHWTRPCRAKPRPASPHCHVRSAILWDIIQHWVVIPYRHFGTTYQSHFQGSRNPNEQTQHDWSYLTQFSFWGCCPDCNFLKKINVLEASYVSIFSREVSNLVDPLDWAILNHSAQQKQ